jgi:hypothetical protein
MAFREVAIFFAMSVRVMSVYVMLRSTMFSSTAIGFTALCGVSFSSAAFCCMPVSVTMFERVMFSLVVLGFLA